MGGEAQRSSDQWSGQGEWETMLLGSYDARYGRALAMLGPAPVDTRNTFDPIADPSDSYDVPITYLVINRRKPRNQMRHKKKFCEKECNCQYHRPQEAWPALEVQYPL